MEAYNWYQFIAAGSKYSKNSPYFNLKKHTTFPLNKLAHPLNTSEPISKITYPKKSKSYFDKTTKPIYLAFPHIIYGFKTEINTAPLFWIPCKKQDDYLEIHWEERIVNYPLLLFLETYFKIHGALISTILTQSLDQVLFEISKYTQPELSQALFKGLLTSIPNDLKSETYYQLNLERRPFLFELNAQLIAMNLDAQYLHFPHYGDHHPEKQSILYHHLQFQDFTRDTVLSQVCRGNHLFIEGAAGTGKTTLLTQLAQYLSHQNIPVCVIVPNPFLKDKIAHLLKDKIQTLKLSELQKIQKLYLALAEDGELIHAFNPQHQIESPYYHFSGAFLKYLLELKDLGHTQLFQSPCTPNKDLTNYLKKSPFKRWFHYFFFKKKYQIPLKRRDFHQTLKKEGLEHLNLRLLHQQWQKTPASIFLTQIHYPQIHWSALLQSFKLMSAHNVSFENFLQDQIAYYLKNQYPNIHKQWTLTSAEIKAPVRICTPDEFKHIHLQDHEVVLVDEANSISCHEIFQAFKHQVIAFADPMQYLHQAQQNLIQQIQGDQSPDLLSWMAYEKWPKIQLSENFRWRHKTAEIIYHYCDSATAQISKVHELLAIHPDAWVVCLRKEDQQTLSVQLPQVTVHHLSTILGLECDHLIFVSHYEVQTPQQPQNFSLLSKQNKAALFHILSTRAREKAYILHSVNLDLKTEKEAFFKAKIRNVAQINIPREDSNTAEYKWDEHRQLLTFLQKKINNSCK